MSKYVNANTKINCKCKICGFEWSSKPPDLLHGHGCPNCSHKGTSFFEQYIYQCLKFIYKDKEVLLRNKQKIGMELDIYIPDINLAIEPGGWYWHKRKLKNDTIKRKKCKENNIRLITIYDAYDSDEKPFEDDCFVSKKDLGMSENFKYLKNLIIELFKYLDIDCTYLENNWEKLKQKTYKEMQHINYFKEINDSNPTIKPLMDIYNKGDKIKFKCLKCNYEWYTTAKVILKGHGCPNCSGVAKKNTEQFIKELKKINPNIDVIGEYKGANIEIECKCKKCNTIWYPKPHKLLLGRGCPECAHNRNRKTDKQFALEVKQKFSTIEVVSKYINTKTRVKVHCKKCNNYWEIKPINLLHSKGCSYCRKIQRTSKN